MTISSILQIFIGLESNYLKALLAADSPICQTYGSNAGVTHLDAIGPQAALWYCRDGRAVAARMGKKHHPLEEFFAEGKGDLRTRELRIDDSTGGSRSSGEIQRDVMQSCTMLSYTMECEAGEVIAKVLSAHTEYIALCFSGKCEIANVV